MKNSMHTINASIHDGMRCQISSANRLKPVTSKRSMWLPEETFGHANSPLRMKQVWDNHVETCVGTIHKGSMV